MIVCLFFTDGQPESIVMDIENMVRSYIEKVLCNLFHCLVFEHYQFRMFWARIVNDKKHHKQTYEKSTKFCVHF